MGIYYISSSPRARFSENLLIVCCRHMSDDAQRLPCWSYEDFEEAKRINFG